MSRYENTKIRKKSLLPKSKKIVNSYVTTYYPIIPEKSDDLHLISTAGDRLDNLSQHFYGTPILWWYIAKANNLKDINIPAGVKLRIPKTPKT